MRGRYVARVRSFGWLASCHSRALINLVRLKQKDEYTYLHSVAVCALMINFARHLKLDEAEVQALGVAGLLHDVGKVAIADDVLLKPGKLTLRERSYVQVARLSGMPGRTIILKEILPNLLPYLASSLVIAVSAAVLASIGLEVLGLGPMNEPTIGMTIFWVQYNAAVINGWWWWWLPPIVIIALLFVSLFLITLGLDEAANPRLRRRA